MEKWLNEITISCNLEMQVPYRMLIHLNYLSDKVRDDFIFTLIFIQRFEVSAA